MNLYLIAAERDQGGWRLVAENYSDRQMQRLGQAMQEGPGVSGPRTGHDGRRIFEYEPQQSEDAIVLHALAVARLLKARVCLRGVALARA